MIVMVALERNPMRPVPEFFEVMNLHSIKFRKVLAGTWLVHAQPYLDAKRFAELLQEQLTNKDYLFVVRTQVDDRDDYGGFMKRDSWIWIRNARMKGDFSARVEEPVTPACQPATPGRPGSLPIHLLDANPIPRAFAARVAVQLRDLFARFVAAWLRYVIRKEASAQGEPVQDPAASGEENI